MVTPSRPEKDILLHACCAPCTTSVLNKLRGEGFQVTAFWYNPNIHPFQEHERRLVSLKEYAAEVNLPLVVWEAYEMPLYFREVAGRESERCGLCYRMRLGRAAQVARERGFSRFTTTLLISVYQDQELILAAGREAAAREGVAFLEADFRTGWQEHYRLSEEAGLYRQKYCGCIYSEWERHTRLKVSELLPILERTGHPLCPS